MTPRADFEDECIHEMSRPFCSYCKEKPKSQVANRRAWEEAAVGELTGPTRRAQFDGHCPDCDYDIEVGDVIALRNKKWVCGTCARDYDVEASREIHPSTSGGE